MRDEGCESYDERLPRELDGLAFLRLPNIEFRKLSRGSVLLLRLSLKADSGRGAAGVSICRVLMVECNVGIGFVLVVSELERPNKECRFRILRSFGDSGLW